MSQALLEKIQEFVSEGLPLVNEVPMDTWGARVISFLNITFGQRDSHRFESLNGKDRFATHGLRIGHLEGLLAKFAAELGRPNSIGVGAATTPNRSVASSRKVFVVHGHDSEAKENTARYLEHIGMEPIILHEHAREGRTLIEKFEMYSDDVAFSVVLLTPDDVGYAAADKRTVRARARQNVIMELGYFIGRLGRMRVCALHKGGIELPSDYQGVVYIELDARGSWKTKLAHELVQAGLSINPTGFF
jgi:predicted nucleotide-binding protein